jgi:DNA-binding beta-propeller fold protein YncE
MAFASSANAQDSYLLYVAAESADEVALLRFTPGVGVVVEKTISVGFWPAEMEGAHGVSVSPDGKYWYLTLGHGFPFGTLLKYTTGEDSLVGRTGLGLFPATIAVTHDGVLAFIVNSNFHGDKTPSTVSVVDTDLMVELDQLQTCTMPHGSRLSADGTRHYSACMVDDLLVEIDTRSVDVSRTLDVSPIEGAPLCSPTWAAPSPNGKHVYVMCNKSHEVVEVGVEEWAVARRWDAPKAPYNAQVTPDGSKLLVTQKASAQFSVWDTESGERLALLPTTRTVTHGVTVSSDGRYAFVSIEGVGGEPGTVDVFDLDAFEKVGSVEIGKQAGGIAFWKIDGR